MTNINYSDFCTLLMLFLLNFVFPGEGISLSRTVVK